MKNNFSRIIAILLTVILTLSALPILPVSAKFDAAKTDFVFLGADKLQVASDNGGTLMSDSEGNPILRFDASQTSKNGAAIFHPDKAGLPDTGDGSFYDYAFYVFRYKTSGNARTSDTINLRGNDETGAHREKYGGNDQITKSDEYTFKTVRRDTFTSGGGASEPPSKNWTKNYITLKMFETSGDSGYLDLDFMAAFKTEADANDFIKAYEKGEFDRGDSIKTSGGEYISNTDTFTVGLFPVISSDNSKLVATLGAKMGELLVKEAKEAGADFINLDVTSTLSAPATELVLEKDAVKNINSDLDVCITANKVKVVLDKAILSELAAIGADITFASEGDGDSVKLSFKNGSSSITTKNKARVLLVANTGDNTAVATVNGTLVPFSGTITNKPVVRTAFPANVSFEANKYASFTDTAGHWATGYINFVSARSLFNGVTATEFAPNGTMTRAMASTVLMRLAGENANGTYTYTYTDVANNAWYAPSVEWVYKTGITDTKTGEFRPDDAITREELAGFIYGFAKYMGLDTKIDTVSSFTDAASVGAAYADAINYCAAKKIINGYDNGSFKPQNSATRAEVSTMINRFINAALKANELDITEYQNIKFDENNIVLSFAALSDIHISSPSESDGSALNYKKAMNTAYDLSTTGELDLVFALGDLCQNVCYVPAKTEEITWFKEHTDRYLRDDTALVYCTGNHDRSGSVSFEKEFTEAFTATQEDIDRYYKYDVDMDTVNAYTGNRHAVVNGYHFISVGMYGDFEGYVKPILDELTAEDPLKPVFVGYHFHATDTVYSTHYSESGAKSNLKTLLDNYPQVVFFSGHTHNGLENPRAIWQGEFTAIDTASVRYLDDNSLINYSIKIPINATHNEVFQYATEGTLVEVDKNNNIRFTCYNGYRGDVVAEYVIAGPKEDGTHLLTYTDDRKAYSNPPVFKEGTKLLLQANAGGAVTILFDQATHEDIVWYYTVEFSAPGKDTIKKYLTSRYYDPKGMPERVSGVVGGFSKGTTYTVTVTPYDVWDQPGKPLTAEFTA